jgi:hypothetical protein
MKTQLIIFFTLCLTVAVSSQRIEYGDAVVISQPVNENLYVGAGNVTINAPINGDLIIAGGNVTINDTVHKDLLVVGGTVMLNGYMGGDLRCAGGTIHVKKDVNGDILSTGGTLTIDKNVTVAGSLIITGGKMEVYGTIKGFMKCASGTLLFNGVVEKDFDNQSGKIDFDGRVLGSTKMSAPDINLGGNAAFMKDVKYWNAAGNLDFKQSLKGGIATFDPTLQVESPKWYYAGGATFLALLWYLGSALLTILLLQYLFSKTMMKAANTAFFETMKSVGYGFLYIIGIPALMVVAFLTIIGLPIGFLLLSGYIMSLIIATSLTSVVAANWLNNRYDKKWTFWQMSFVALGIFVVIKLLTFVFVLGWFIITIAVLIAFGAILLNVNWRKKTTSLQEVKATPVAEALT